MTVHAVAIGAGEHGAEHAAHGAAPVPEHDVGAPPPASARDGHDAHR